MEVGWRVCLTGKDGSTQLWIVAIEDRTEAIAAVKEQPGVMPESTYLSYPASQSELDAFKLKSGEVVQSS